MQKEQSSFWLNKFHSDGLQPQIQELMYYRTKLPAFARHARNLPAVNQSGPVLSKFRGRGMEFDEVRHYQVGDDIRAIDWRVTARTGKAHTKLYREEKERPVFLVVDLALTQLFGSQLLFKSVQACHLAAALAWQAQQRGDRVGGIVSNGWLHREHKPVARKPGVMRFLHGLLDVHKDSFQRWQQQQKPHQAPLSDTASRLQKLVKPGSLINIISDFQQLQQHQLEPLARLNKRNSVRCFQLFDPMEYELPSGYSAQALAVFDGEQQAQVNLADQTQRRLYQQQAEARHQQQEALFEQFGLPLTLVNAAQALEQQWPKLR
ncbi:DUF58 domain-containing protein [Idiomarina seosinensis]|uniref:DUF58 domain-containing protein n=1 Tax=Idiomarina seosinensis TaxID=281739 RepID=UPI00384E0902